MSIRSLVRTVVVVCCVCCGALVLMCSSTFAEKIFYPGVSFGGSGSGEGQFDEPTGVAVNDETGDVYVADNGNDRVEYFSASGAFVGEFDVGAKAEQVAVDNSGDPLDPSKGDVYVVASGRTVIDRFGPSGVEGSPVTGASVCELSEEAPPCKEKEKEAFRSFADLRGVTVDSNGDLWVYGGLEPDSEGSHVIEFNDTGAFIGMFATKAFSHSNHAVAVGCNEDVFIGGGQEEEVRQFNKRREVVQELSKGVLQQAHALSVVPAVSSQLACSLLVDQGGRIDVFGPPSATDESEPYSKEPSEEFPSCEGGLPGECISASFGLAVNASATVYASERGADKVQSFNYVSVPVVVTKQASGVTETGLTLNGNVNAEGEIIEKCYFEYGSEEGKYTNKIECGVNEGNPGKGCGDNPSGKSEAVEVCAVLAGLEPAGVRSFRLVVEAGSHLIRRSAGLAVARPTASEVEASEVGLSSATVSAVIDAGALDTCYWVDYGTSVSYGSETAKSCVGPGEDEKAKVELAKLQPNTTYHFRFEASNELGVKPGVDAHFVTFSASSAGLPDGRVYEAVSSVLTGDETNVYVPAGMKGALDDLDRHGVFTNHLFQVAADGDGVAYVGYPPVRGGNGNDGVGGGNQYVAAGASGGGWREVSVNPPGFSNEYVALSGDLSVGVVGSSEKLSEDAPEEVETGKAYGDLYGRLVGWRVVAGSLEPALGSFEPLITATPPCPVAEFGGDLKNKLSREPLFGGGNAGGAGTAAFGHLLVEVDVALPSIPSTTTPRGCRVGGVLEDDVYDSVGGQLYLVNVLPDGKPQAGATVGRQGLSPDGHRSPDTSNAVSVDGSRIFWSAVTPVGVEGEVEERPTALYVRENDTDPEGEHGECGEFVACTVEVDASQVPEGSGKLEKKEREENSGGGQFWTASVDGSQVFFTDEGALTKGASAGPGAPDLYEYDLEAPEGQRLSDLSVPVGAGPGMHGDVLGVVGTSEDGSYVYFVAGGVLSEGTNAEGDTPVVGEANLYVRHGGVTRFIATLSGEAGGDDEFTHGTEGDDGDWQADSGHRTAEVSADGRSVVFMSRRNLTGYDNELDGVPLTEVFVYEMGGGGGGGGGAGRLVCVSCNRSGEGPVVPAVPEFAEQLSKVWGSFLPVSDSLVGYQPRVVSESGGRVFFDSIEPLVPQDEGESGFGNGFVNVYEWERDGMGSCHEVAGCIFLLSGGQSDDNSYLIGGSGSGDDVFFVSRAQLVKADHGDDDVVYDARVDGVESSAGAKCSGAGCQGQPSAAPLFATPASETFMGPGNPPVPVSSPPVCSKGRRLSHGKCVVKSKPKKKRGVKHHARGKRSTRRSTRPGRRVGVRLGRRGGRVGR
jgi:NHL repeat